MLSLVDVPPISSVTSVSFNSLLHHLTHTNYLHQGHQFIKLLLNVVSLQFLYMSKKIENKQIKIFMNIQTCTKVKKNQNAQWHVKCAETTLNAKSLCSLSTSIDTTGQWHKLKVVTVMPVRFLGSFNSNPIKVFLDVTPS